MNNLNKYTFKKGISTQLSNLSSTDQFRDWFFFTLTFPWGPFKLKVTSTFNLKTETVHSTLAFIESHHTSTVIIWQCLGSLLWGPSSLVFYADKLLILVPFFRRACGEKTLANTWIPMVVMTVPAKKKALPRSQWLLLLEEFPTGLTPALSASRACCKESERAWDSVKKFIKIPLLKNLQWSLDDRLCRQKYSHRVKYYS